MSQKKDKIAARKFIFIFEADFSFFILSGPKVRDANGKKTRKILGRGSNNIRYTPLIFGHLFSFGPKMEREK